MGSEMPPWNEHDTTINTCPVCLYLTEAATNLSSTSPPQDGDASICAGCAAVNIFDSTASGGLRRPTPDEQRSLDRDPLIRRAVAAMLRILSTKPKKGTS